MALLANTCPLCRPAAGAAQGHAGLHPLREPGRGLHGPARRLHRRRPLPQQPRHLRCLSKVTITLRDFCEKTIFLCSGCI